MTRQPMDRSVGQDSPATDSTAHASHPSAIDLPAPDLPVPDLSAPHLSDSDLPSPDLPTTGLSASHLPATGLSAPVPLALWRERHAALADWYQPRAAYVANRLRTIAAYRMDVLIWLMRPALHIVLLGALWRALYSGRDTVDGVSLPVMTTYVSMAAVHHLLSDDDAVDWLHPRLREGQISGDLARPVGLLTQQMCGQVAQLLAKIVMIALLLPVGAVASGLSAPAPGALGPYALSAMLGFLISSSLNLLVAVVCFWTLETHGMTFLYYTISAFLSGALVPLWFMPDWLRTAIECLPLQAVVFTPLSIYLGQATGGSAWRAIGVQLLWAALLAGAVRLAWQRAIRRVEVQGG